MEALSVGMYVRTLNGIVKIYKIQDNVMEDTKGHLHYGDFVKASYNIIDILEVGDIITTNNLCGEITKIDRDKIYTTCYDGEYCYVDDIKSVVTKEQFEQMSYKIEE